MKRFWIAALCLLLLASHRADALPRLVEEVVKNKEFFATFEGYDDHYLYDVHTIGEGRIGLVLLSPLGFEIRLAMEKKGGRAIYENILVPEKSKRVAMRQVSISMADAVKLAKSVVAHGIAETRSVLK